MTQVDTGFKYFPLQGEDLELLKKYHEELLRFDQDMKDLKNEFDKRSKTSHDNSQAKLYQIWKQLAVSVNIDPDTTWGDGRYGIEGRYLEDGFGALTYCEYPSNIMELMQGAIDKPDEDDEVFDNILPPEGTKLN